MPNCIKKAFQALYRKVFSWLPVGNYIIFESVPDLGDSTKPVFDEMVRRGLNKTYKLVWWVSNKKDVRLPKINNVVYVDNTTRWNKRLFYYYRMRAKCFIYCNKFLRKEDNRTKSFYITHGTAIKSIKSYYRAPEDLDYCFVTSPYVADMMAEQNSVPPHKMVALGYPRNDALSTPLRDLHSVLQKDYEKVIVWYPTYRQHKDAKAHTAGNALPIIHDAAKAEVINGILKENRMVIVVKPHFAQDISYVKDLNLSNIVFIDDDFFEKHAITSYQFVGSCDALLTDYSSVYYDYLLCEKPIGLVWEDIDTYREHPGFAVDLDYYMKAGEKIYTMEDFVRFIENVATDNDSLKAERAEINAVVNYASDGKNTQRVVDFIAEKAAL